MVVENSNEAKVAQALVEQRKKYGKLLDADGQEFLVPDYTLKEVYEAIPKECFERNAIKSIRYLVQDLSLLTLTFLAFKTYNVEAYVPFILARFALWLLYGFMQMIFGCGIWILAHECGHMAFSQNQLLNDIIGLFLHSALLVPYFSWKITHKYHHKGVGNSKCIFNPPLRFIRDVVFMN